MGARVLAGFVCCCSLAGCASNDLMLKRQTEAEAKIEHLIQADRSTSQQINELGAQVLSLENQLKTFAEQDRQLQKTIQELRASHEELTARLTLVAKRSATPKIEVVNPDVPEKQAETGPPPAYLKAFGLYSANNFAAAITAFEAFLAASPESEYAPNALYWIGECHYSQSDLPKAKAAFQKAAEKYPKSSKAPDALLKLGYTLAAMNEREKATALFQSLITTYPASPAATKARERLTAH